MYVRPALPNKEAIFEKIAIFKPFKKVSINQTMLSVSEKNFEEVADGNFLLSWKLEEPSDSLKVY